jgi:hypothetical protein
MKKTDNEESENENAKEENREEEDGVKRVKQPKLKGEINKHRMKKKRLMKQYHRYTAMKVNLKMLEAQEENVTDAIDDKKEEKTGIRG